MDLFMAKTKMFYTLLWIQGIYTLITAVWPLLHIESFVKVTGPKTDIWPVKTVAVLLVAISVCFISNIFIKTNKLPVILLALTSCIGLICIDFYYTSNDVISWVYMLDGILQIIFMVAWIYILIPLGAQMKKE